MDHNCECEFCSPEPEPIPVPWERTGDVRHEPRDLWMAEAESEPEWDETPTLTLIPLITPR
ncbi:hypothetical protein [Actinocrinis sp.]|uniref:hypothetical protein n=1 Tax=Actinocrinis sp. TaxID=1920516 RepID=UPI002BE8AA47|nr:hypothetical protein [Actinocrinis sp.]HXR72142.1 hypothetical protein [Actinocrinis sp.]